MYGFYNFVILPEEDGIDLDKEGLYDAEQDWKENLVELQKAFFEISLSIPQGSTLEEALELASSFIRLESVCECPLLPQDTTPQVTLFHCIT